MYQNNTLCLLFYMYLENYNIALKCNLNLFLFVYYVCVQADIHRCAMAWVSEANSVKTVFSFHHLVLGIKLRF